MNRAKNLILSGWVLGTPSTVKQSLFWCALLLFSVWHMWSNHDFNMIAVLAGLLIAKNCLSELVVIFEKRDSML